jgi:hypothetical protein
MSKSLIRKNQLHPDIADLVSGYGDNFFITQGELDQALLGLEADFSLETVVYTTGNQTINGVKNFNLRPTFNGIGLATTGEAGGGGTTVFSGNRAITANVVGFKDLNPGGNDVVAFLNNVFYPFAQAIITLNDFPLQELGTSLNNISYIGSINPGSLTFGTDINNWTPFVNGIERTPIIPTPGANFSTGVNLGGVLTNTVSNCFARINTKNQAGNVITLSSSPTKSIFFEAPIYAGSGALNLTDNALNMRNILSGQGITNPSTNNGKALIFEPSSRIVTVTTNGYYYFVYPQNWGLLNRIEDINFNLSFLSDFTSGTIQLPLINGANHLYRWYRNINQITLNSYGVRYIF